MSNKVLVIATHADDETLGCGGTLLKHKANGDSINWLICTLFDKNHKYYKKRENEIKKVSYLYEFDEVINLRLKTTEIDKYSRNELVEKISNAINKVEPNIIYLPFKNDIHSDHRIIFEVAYSCTKIFRYPFIKKILMTEVVSETDFADITNGFIPNVFVDISDFFDKKIEILNIFENELGLHPFPRSVNNLKALNLYRGSQANCKYAESFMLLKEII